MTRITFHIYPLYIVNRFIKYIKHIIMGDSFLSKSFKIFCAVAAYWYVKHNVSLRNS